MTPNAMVFAFAIPFVGWRLYSRARRSIGRQQSKAWRHWTAAILFPLLVLMLTLVMLGAPLTLGGLYCGLVIGIGLGRWGLTLTQFERTPEGMFFTPNPYLGTALVALFAMRIAYRFFQMYSGDLPPPGDPTGGLGRSPFTLAILGLLAGYYSTYAIGLLRWRHQKASSAGE